MSDFGIRELYDVNIRTTYPMEFCGKSYEENEIILRLDRIGIAAVSTSKTRITATGGDGNRALIIWESINPMRMQIQQGIISKIGLSLLSNNLLKTKETVSAPITEKFEIIVGSKNQNFILKHKVNEEKSIFVYNENFEKKNYVIEDGNILKINNFSENDKEIIIDYYTDKNESEILRIGKNLLGGFLKLEAKTRVKDDITGEEKTGIFVIPKMKIMSDLSMRLGDSVEPFVYSFMVEGYPVGPRGEQYVGDLVFLNEDLDVDI